ncbi:MAG: methionyl-tRNA formyltransferase [Bacteroidales bacterium]
MTEIHPRIVFMGTPWFAVASLRALLVNGYSVVCVVTAPDKPAGRGQKLATTPVKDYAVANHLPLLQSERLRDSSFVSALKDLNADIFVVVAFRMLPEEVWALPRLGTFNLHASLLPQYRGAAPVNHAIINGETLTGVTTFLIDKEIDTGKILLSKETEIFPEDNAGSLHDRLMEIGAGLVVETVKGLYEGRLKPVPQKTEPGIIIHAAPKIFPSDTIVDWKESAVRIHNKIRGLSPYPGAVTTIKSENKTLRLKLFQSRLNPEDNLVTATGTYQRSGVLVVREKSRLFITCGSGEIEILSLQPEGRKKMTSSEFLRGFDLTGWVSA